MPEAPIRVSLEFAPEQLALLVAALAEPVAAVLARERAAAPAASSLPYLSVSEAADYLRCSRQRIYDLVSAGELERRKDGARLLLNRAELDAYLAGTALSPRSKRYHAVATKP